MIDYVKFVLKGINPQQLIDNPLLSFFDKIERRTGELGGYQESKYKGLLFKVYYEKDSKQWYNRITLEGSLHKYWNNGRHNFNDFSIMDLFSVLKSLKEDFGIEPKNCYINQIEFGLNFIVPFDVKTFLSYCIMHKTTMFKWCKTNKKGNYILAEYQRYAFKLYDKATQYRNQNYKIDNEILRIEIKHKNMQDLRSKYSIFSLDDLLNFGIEKITSSINKKWNDVIFFEKEIFKNSKYEFKYNNINFWEDLSYANFKYHRSQMEEKIKKSGGGIKEEISKKIQEKINKMSTYYPN